LALGSRFATYDLVIRDGDPVYPVPWARDASASFLLTESETRTDWFKTVMAAQGQSGPNLGLVMGPDFPAMTSNSRTQSPREPIGCGFRRPDSRLKALSRST
jgi:hypothetical protein